MLGHEAIKWCIEQGHIRVEPEPAFIGVNSIDLRLGNKMLINKSSFEENGYWRPVDPHRDELHMVPLGFHEDADCVTEGWLLEPGEFYLGETLETTYCRGLVPKIDGRSTTGRFGVSVHQTAGVGDNGFDGRWTLEITVNVPIILRPGDRICQVYFEPCWSREATKRFFRGRTVLTQQGLKSESPHVELNHLYGGDNHHYTNQQGATVGKKLD
jgi:deoxycytidine triphosphate deaminase